MKPFRWDEKKDAKLRSGRGINFVDVLVRCYAGGILDDIVHPNAGRYPNQRIMVIELKGYAYLVPYVETSDAIFWKTIIPSRKMTQKYLRRTLHDKK